MTSANAPPPDSPRYIAKLTGSGGIKVAAEFRMLTEAIRWLTSTGLEAFDGKADRGDVYLDGAWIWTKANPTTPEREQTDKAVAEQLLTKLADNL